MKLYLLSSDSDTLTGLRLAGIDGALVESAESLDAAIEGVLSREDIAIVLVTRTLSTDYPAQIDALKRNPKLLVTEIPDMAHPTVDTDSITRYVAAAVGSSV